MWKKPERLNHKSVVYLFLKLGGGAVDSVFQDKMFRKTRFAVSGLTQLFSLSRQLVGLF